MRLDTWLWAVRFFHSRTQATASCRGGKVRVGGRVAKPAVIVGIGDRITWHDAMRNRDVEVVSLPPTRVSAPQAATAYVDHSEPLLPKEFRGVVPQRDRGAGRPEKRDRRDLDELRGYQK